MQSFRMRSARLALATTALTLPLAVACSENVPGGVAVNPGPVLSFVDDPNFELAAGPADVVVQILHAGDQEGGTDAVELAPIFAQIVEGLKADPAFPNTLTLGSGDAFIPGSFFSASGGTADIIIQNEIGFQAIALGNHEFDNGTDALEGLIEADDDYPGTAFPYLSANLDFSNDGNLSDLVVDGGQAPQGNAIAPSTVITVNGEDFGVVGATTPRLESISNVGDVEVEGETALTDPLPGSVLQDMADEIQAAVDDLTGSGIDKIILLSHLQDLNNEVALAALLSDVDVIIGGGSDTVLADSDDDVRDDFNETREGAYPVGLVTADGDPVVLVNTGREYRYVGRLVVGFTADGLLADINDASGIFPTNADGIAAANAEGASPSAELTAAIDDVSATLIEQDGNTFGSTSVFLNGERSFVRSEETNLGNLTADANLARAQQEDTTVAVSLKNGGGIRANIGSVSATEPPTFGPPAANDLTGKEEGQVSELDITNALRFNNNLTLLTVTAEQLKVIVEHSVASVGAGAFPQVGGMAFSFDPAETAQELDEDGTVTTAGTRIRTLSIVDGSGAAVDTIVQDGQVVGDASRQIRIVTLGFLAGGGDGYPFPSEDDPAANFVQLGDVEDAVFETDGREQAALADFLAAGPEFSDADTPVSEDTRIQNLSERSDTIPVQ